MYVTVSFLEVVFTDGFQVFALFCNMHIAKTRDSWSPLVPRGLSVRFRSSVGFVFVLFFEKTDAARVNTASLATVDRLEESQVSLPRKAVSASAFRAEKRILRFVSFLKIEQFARQSAILRLVSLLNIDIFLEQT